MENKNKKGSRSENYSLEEIEILINELEKYQELVSGQFSARFPTKKELTEQWKDVAKKLSASNFGIVRNYVQVRNKWNDLKYRVKQKSLKYNEHMCKTGGGEGKRVPYTPTETRIIGLIGKRCIEGITDDSCDTATLTLKNLKKANLTHLPNNDGVDGTISETNADDSDFMTHLPTNGVNDTISDINADDSDITGIESIEYSIIEDSFPVTDQENVQVVTDSALTTPKNLHMFTENVQVVTDSALTTPKTQWPVRKSSNSSTIRGQNFRAKKRKRTETEMEKFEKDALNMQRNMSQQLEKLTDIACAQKDCLRSMCQQLEILNGNVEVLVKKIDHNSKLLALNLNDEDLAYQ